MSSGATKRCPHCHQPVKVPPLTAPAVVKCSRCQGAFRVSPVASTAPSVVPPQAPVPATIAPVASTPAPVGVAPQAVVPVPIAAVPQPIPMPIAMQPMPGVAPQPVFTPAIDSPVRSPSIADRVRARRRSARLTFWASILTLFVLVGGIGGAVLLMDGWSGKTLGGVTPVDRLLNQLGVAADVEPYGTFEITNNENPDKKLICVVTKVRNGRLILPESEFPAFLAEMEKNEHSKQEPPASSRHVLRMTPKPFKLTLQDGREFPAMSMVDKISIGFGPSTFFYNQMTQTSPKKPIDGQGWSRTCLTFEVPSDAPRENLKLGIDDDRPVPIPDRLATFEDIKNEPTKDP